MGEKIVHVSIRFPVDVRDRVKSFADRDRRSLNAEVIQLLEEAMDAREAKPPRSSDYRYPEPGEHASARLMRAAETRPADPPPSP